jgi:hypothetical protein
MFVRDFVHVDHDFTMLAPRFLAADEWLDPIMVDAAREVLADGPITCAFGPAREHAGTVVVPVRSGSFGPMPALDGDLRVAPFGHDRSHISLSAIWSTERFDAVSTQHLLDDVARTFLRVLVAALGTDRQDGV